MELEGYIAIHNAFENALKAERPGEECIGLVWLPKEKAAKVETARKSYSIKPVNPRMAAKVVAPGSQPSSSRLNQSTALKGTPATVPKNPSTGANQPPPQGRTSSTATKLQFNHHLQNQINHYLERQRQLLDLHR